LLPFHRFGRLRLAWSGDSLLRYRRRDVSIEVEALLGGSRLPLLDRHCARRAAGGRAASAHRPAATAAAPAGVPLGETRRGRCEKEYEEKRERFVHFEWSKLPRTEIIVPRVV
jgi:hypothetical protein